MPELVDPEEGTQFFSNTLDNRLVAVVVTQTFLVNVESNNTPIAFLKAREWLHANPPYLDPSILNNATCHLVAVVKGTDSAEDTTPAPVASDNWLGVVVG